MSQVACCVLNSEEIYILGWDKKNHLGGLVIKVSKPKIEFYPQSNQMWLMDFSHNQIKLLNFLDKTWKRKLLFGDLIIYESRI